MCMVHSAGLGVTWSKITVYWADAWCVHVPRSLSISCSYARCLNGFARLSMMDVKTDLFAGRAAWKIAVFTLCRTCFEAHIEIKWEIVKEK